jgi:hypothetical protein
MNDWRIVVVVVLMLSYAGFGLYLYVRNEYDRKQDREPAHDAWDDIYPKGDCYDDDSY